MTWLLDALGRLFSADEFVPRRVCGSWPNWLVWEHVGGNALVWIAYCAIPVMIWGLGVRRPDWKPFRNVVLSFALFIGLCGLGHFLDMLAFFRPMYRLSGLVLIATGLASCTTAWSLRLAWPALMAMRSPDELERIIAERTKQLVESAEALREGERRFRAIFDSTFQYIGLVAPDGTVLEINRTALEFAGANLDDVVGRPCWETLWWAHDQEARDRLRVAIADAGEGRFVRYEVDHRHADGRGMTVDFSLKPVLDESGRVVLLIAEARDITERKHAELTLASLAAIVESSDDAIIGKDLDGVVKSWNRGAERLFGYTAAEAIGRPITFLFPPDRIDEESVILKRLRLGEGVDQYESIRLARDGRAIDVSLTISPIRDRSGRVVAISKIARDITERVKAEVALREARDAAMAATRAKSDFLANMCHEIRTPMNGVMGICELLLDTRLDDLQLKYATTIRSSGEALMTVINDILDLSKIEAGRMIMVATEFDARELLNELVALLGPRAQQKGVRLTACLSTDFPIKLHGDVVRIRQILTNLAGNAIKFTDEGEVAIGGRTIRLSPAGATIRIEVRDTGSGIPASKQGAIFESFTQAEVGSMRSASGTGLGLAICRNLADLLGGEVGFVSEEGRGSTFWLELTLPLPADSPAQPPGQGAAIVPDRSPPSRRLKVLIADDNATNLMVLDGLISRMGHRVEMVRNGREAVEAHARDEFDLILLDVEMPEMDGYAAAAEIRLHEAASARSTPIIAATAYALNDERERSVAAGMDDFLTKPITLAALRDVFDRFR